MTLIVAALTKKKGFLFGDQTRTISSKDGSPIQIQMDNIKITTTGNVYWQNSGTKIIPICNNTAYIAMAGSDEKFKTFVQALREVKKYDDINSFTSQYWLKHGDDSPDQFILLSKSNDKVFTEYYFKYEDARYKSYCNYTYLPKDSKVLFIAIGSGSEAFYGFIRIVNDEIEKQYNEAFSQGSILQWENDLKEKIKSIYSDIHHQIRGVGEDVDIAEVEL